jgi:uncharacterized membrane protein
VRHNPARASTRARAPRRAIRLLLLLLLLAVLVLAVLVLAVLVLAVLVLVALVALVAVLVLGHAHGTLWGSARDASRPAVGSAWPDTIRG